VGGGLTFSLLPWWEEVRRRGNDAVILPIFKEMSRRIDSLVQGDSGQQKLANLSNVKGDPND